MNQLIEDNRVAVSNLCRRLGVCELDLFGSATTKAFSPDKSDLDFAVRFHECSPEEHAERFFALLAGLQDLFTRRVDLVEVGAIQNPYFRESVESSRVRLYAA